MRLTIVIATLCLVAGKAVAADTPPAEAGGAMTGPVAALQHMTEATRHLNYEGVFVYQNGTHLSTLQVVHAWYDGHAHERLISRDGSRREVLIDGNNVTYVRPADKSIVIIQRRPHEGLPGGLGLDIWKTPYYRPQWDGNQRIAGMPCRTVQLQPVDQLRYARRICIDTKYSLPLKSEVVDAHGVVIERMLFTSLQVLRSVPRATFAPPVLGSGYSLKRLHDAQSAASADWSFKNLPVGFELTATRERNLGADGQHVSQYVLSDGVSTISVFVAPSKGGDASGHFLHSGALTVYAVTLQGHDVTVMGEVPKQAILDVVAGLSYQGHQS